MSNMELVALWVGIIALIALIVFTALYIYYKRRSHRRTKTKDVKVTHEEIKAIRSHGKKHENEEVEDAEPITYTSNERLDGARVSHRRSHPDRIAQEMIWKEQKEQETTEIQKKLSQERKNKLFMVYSPCNGDVLHLFEQIENAKEFGFGVPGVILYPNDDKIYAPVDGVVNYSTDHPNCIRIQSENGIEIQMSANPHSKEGEAKEENHTIPESQPLLQDLPAFGSVVRVGEIIGKLSNPGGKRNERKSELAVLIHSYEEGQMVLVKRVNYVSHGDKIITLRRNP